MKVLLLLALLGAAQAVHLDFSAGLDGWEGSSDAKYTGRMAVESPGDGLPKALKGGEPRPE